MTSHVVAAAETAAVSSAATTPAAWRVMLVLSTLMAFASISTDLYLPALPTMANALHASAGTLALTIAGYLAGFSSGQLFWGPVGDRYGRRRPVIIGIVLFVIGSAGCALSTDTWQIISCRVLQAIGACAGVVLARAMVRDLYEKDRAAQMMSTLMTVMAVAPLLGPAVGGQILALAGWRAIFWTLVGVGLLTLAGLFLLPETLPREQRSAEKLGRAFLRYGDLVQDRVLLGYIGVGGFFYGGMFAYIAGSPFAYINYHHVSPQLYGLLFALGIAGIMITNLINARLVTRMGSDRLLRFGTIAAALAGFVLAVTAWTGFGGLAGLVASLFVFIAAAGFIIANSIVGALARSSRHAGAVSALLGAAQYGAGMFSSALVGAFANGTPMPMGLIIALSGLGSALCVRFLLVGSSRPAAPRH
jgi:MFS transporter, DHA1 family, multidrug resistance protein